MIEPLYPFLLDITSPKTFSWPNYMDEPKIWTMAKNIQSGMDNKAIARRLRILRHHVTGSDFGAQARFASQIGIEYRSWNNYEAGYNLSRDKAMLLVQRIHGLTLDWIYLGREDGLSTKLQRALVEAEKAVTLSEDDPDTSSGSSRNLSTSSRI